MDSGYITSPGYDGITPASDVHNAVHYAYNLTVALGYDAVMISFEQLRLQAYDLGCLSILELSVFDLNTRSMTSVWRRCNQVNVSAEVFQTSTISLNYLKKRKITMSVGFKMRYSFHKKDAMPEKLSTGSFNCSVPHYSTFQQHLHCNLEVECDGGQDETGDCPFSRASCGALSLASGDKCLSAVLSHDVGTGQSWKHFNQSCLEKGGTLAVIHTQRDLSDLRKLLSFGKIGGQCRYYTMGATYGEQSLPNMYRRTWTGEDKSVLLDVSTTSKLTPGLHVISGRKLCQKFDSWFKDTITLHPCMYLTTCGAVCEVHIQTPIITSDRSEAYFNQLQHFDGISSGNALVYRMTSALSNKGPKYIICPRTHTTHLFLVCAAKLSCGEQHNAACTINDNRTVIPYDDFTGKDVLTMPQFACESGIDFVPYTLVCDFRADCQDQSDETFCRHAPCLEMACSNGQCFSFTGRCDEHADCLDNSDEENCEDYYEYTMPFVDFGLPTPALINFDGRGQFTFVHLNDTDPCPDTHFRCSGQLAYCLPVYTRCNGYYDCPDREDERGCGNVTCPGLFRCRGSSVCLHVDHVCDGWPQCPRHDDELLCGQTACPSGCQCYGTAFICTHPFSVQMSTQLRYLDGTGSGMTPANLTSNVYLVHLTLSKCSIVRVIEMDLPNLRHLDLSSNDIEDINMNVFVNLVSLKLLSLAGNPLRSMWMAPSKGYQRSLKLLDLSFTQLKVFSSKPLSPFLTLQTLNLSHSSIEAIDEEGFDYVPGLVKLDMRGSPVRTFPADVLQGLSELQTMSSQTYKLCCQQMLPRHFDNRLCHAPRDEISDCEDLLRSGTYRGFMWLMSILSITGNVFCLIFRTVVNKKSTKNAFNLFVSCLSLADLLMGVYITIIGSADLVFRGVYLNVDTSWMKSVACQAAGFLSLVSSEVSAVSILFITIDRFITLRFPFSRFRLERRAAVCVCGFAWVFGLVLATIPLLPLTAHWEFYGQTGICVPLPITRNDFEGQSYSFGVMIIFNFVLFLIIAVGQAMIYWSVRKNSMTCDTTRKSRDTTIARRLITVALTDFLCWFPIGICGMLALSGVPIPGEVNVAMAIFVLPLNSAFNPFIYTLNVVMEKRRQKYEVRLLRDLRARLLEAREDQIT